MNLIGWYLFTLYWIIICYCAYIEFQNVKLLILFGMILNLFHKLYKCIVLYNISENALHISSRTCYEKVS